MESTRGTSVTLYTFTNADEVELRLNGKTFGRKVNNRSDSKERNRIVWENVPYTSGSVEAVAYNSGKPVPVARHRIETTGDVVAIKAVPDDHEWKADGKDLCHIMISAVDKKVESCLISRNCLRLPSRARRKLSA